MYISPMDLDVWARRSHWYEPHVGSEGLAALLSVRQASVRQYQSTVEGFPQAVKESDGRVRWIEAQIYDYIAAERPHLRHRIPRLYPIQQLRPEPAQFAGAELVELSGGPIRVAVHYWLPSDDRGHIAVVYFGGAMLAKETQWVAVDILERSPWVSAVVVPSDSGAGWPDPHFPDPFSPQRHREVAVAQRGQYDAEFDGEVGWLDRFSWSDLANLLRVDVPYWPVGLRNVEAISAWRPGEVQTLPPCPRPDSTTAHLRAALEHSCTTSTELNELLVNVCRYLDYEIARDGGLLPETDRDFPQESPGLVRAAVPAVVKEPPPAPSPAQISQLLHLPADARYAEAGLRAGHFVGLWASVVAGSARLRRSALGPLGQQWRSRLQRVENVSQRDEFGYVRIASWLSPPQLDSATWLYDPLHADCWIIETHDTIHVTYPRNLPGAQGELTSVQIGVDVGDAFMADSSGTAWLMPRTELNDYGVGYNGGAPRALTVALEDLLADIHAPSPGRRLGGISDEQLPAALLSLLIASPGPLTLTRAQIKQLIDPSAVDESALAANVFAEPMVAADDNAPAVAADEAPPGPVAKALFEGPLTPGLGVMFWPDRAGRMVAIDSRQLTDKSPAPSVPVAYHDFDGQPLERQAWEQLFAADLEGQGRRLIGSWTSQDGVVRVTTVWTGVSVTESDPLIYHTTIAGGPYADNSVHYRSLADAQFGHARTVTEVQEGRFPWFLIPQ